VLKSYRSRLSWLAFLIVLSVVAFTAVGTSAFAATRQFSLDVGTHSAGAGTAPAYSATVTNESGGTLDSVTLVPPTGFNVVSPAGGTFTGLGLGNGSSTTLVFTAMTPCVASGSFNWSATGKGSTNQTYALDTSANSNLATAVTGSCALVFTGQPTSAQKGAVITTTPYDPSAPPVTVVLDDANGAATTQSDGTSVTLSLSSNPGTISGGSAQLSGGSATFTSLKVSQASLSYSLTAGVSSNSSISTATSTAFQIWDQRQKCNANSPCSNLYTPSSRDLTTQADATFPSDGGILISYNVDTSPCAPDSYSHIPDGVTVDSEGGQLPSGAWLIKLSVAKFIDQQQAQNGANFYQICLVTKVSFTTLGGTPATACSGTDCPVGFYYGLVQNAPHCTDPQPNVCLLSKSKSKSGVVVLVLQLPPGDPRAH
jgi:hypothetical protein